MSDAPNVLIVAPDEDDAKRLSQALGTLKARTRLAHNGQEAILFTGKRPPDLVIMEVDLPMVHGIEVCRFLKTKFHEQSLPILVISSRHDAELRDEAALVGCDELIPKPVGTDELVAASRSLIDLGRAENDLTELEQRLREAPKGEEPDDGERPKLVERVCKLRVEAARRSLGRHHPELAEAHVERVARLDPSHPALAGLRAEMGAKP
jgi:PleD family two-component response regulator